MRNYLIHYYAEVNDECVDREYPIRADDITKALSGFKEKVRLYKRITKIEEV